LAKSRGKGNIGRWSTRSLPKVDGKASLGRCENVKANSL
jgi:hypothetical protein